MISKVIAEELIHKVKREIEDAEKIVMVSHFGPDGDSLGASLGMWHFLMTLEKAPTVIVPTPPPNFLMWMPGADKILVYVLQKKEADKIIEAADLIFALDFNTPSRLAMMEEAVVASKARKVMIDHHLNPDKDFTDVIISYPQISSTSELIFRLICRMGHFSDINLGCAESIYTGMMTDTGGFTFNSNHEEIYSIIHELIKIGVDKDIIYRKVYDTFSEQRMRLQGYCIYKKMKVYPEYQAALITLTREEMEEFQYENGDAEGFVNIPLSIREVIFSVLMREDPGKIKVSLRSQGTFPANKFAEEIFNGGGHLNASGGESYTTMEEAVRKFEEGLPRFKEFLNPLVP
ncbi:MAG: bifunctional oligoribonuclease/PAP phosphatase NrnA [Porphyromonadaceae bacterium]|jgi:phosphoesterase RecJ-like protein|nr:bifunctional oligoribonuclease/PAP phosphatase NrnA [Porphyromonadaceae bacterium]